MTGLEAKQQLEAYRPKINKLLRQFFNKYLQTAKKDHPFLGYLYERAGKQIMRGGKRLRPVLMIKAYRAVGGTDVKEIEKAALGAEFFHNFLLLHDDVMDQDDQRHGGPSLHKVCEQYHRRSKFTGDAARFGESMAVDVGDIVAALGYEAILLSNFPFSRRVQAAQIMNQAMLYTGKGQALDILVEVRNKASQDVILKIHKYKTAHYTIETPLLAGSVLGGAPAATQKMFSRYAIPLGIAFQIQDDILGVYADEAKLGKPIGSDLREGKQTLLTVYALNKGNVKQKKELGAILEKPKLKNSDIEIARGIIADSGALDYSQKLAKTYARRARRIIETAKIRKSERDFFSGIASYIIERDF
ncbi:polyprenyl synthetase family protein [Patescibacteria group bacterium]